MSIRVGLVGAGYVAHIHADAYKQICDVGVEVAAVAASTLESAQAFAARHGIAAAYGDYRHILAREDIDLVDVCAPNALHEPIVVAAAAAGKHVACEKPLTGYFGGPDAAEPVGATPRRAMLRAALASAERMHAAAERAGVQLMYAENWVYAPVIQRTVELVEQAGGTVFEIRAEESHSGSHARYARQWALAGGGSLMRLAPHPIGAALYLKQREGIARGGGPIRAVAVSAEVADLTRMPSFQAEERHWVADNWHDVENWASMVITFADGSRAIILASDVSLGGIETPFEVRMSNARIRADMSHSGLIRAFAPDPAVWGDAYLMEKVDHKGGWSYPSVDEAWMLGYPQEMRDFVAAAAHGRPPRATAALGREVVQAIYAGYLSAAEGRRVDL